MINIKIISGNTEITFPKTKKVKDVGAPEAKEITMAGGKIVQEVVGFRPAFSYDFDYLPDAMIKALIPIARSGRFVNVNYFDVDGVDKEGEFKLSYPQFSVFTFRQGVPIWHECSITITSTGVV